MALAHILGFPNIGCDPELRATHWQLQKDAGIELLPVGDQNATLDWEQLFEQVAQAKALGHAVKPVIIGPLTYLWQSEAPGGDLDKLEQIDRLLPLYDEVLNRLAAQGVEWVQIDEPILAHELPQDWKNAYERVYNILQRAPLKKLVATYFGGLEDRLGLAANLPVDGLHIDVVRAPEQFPTILDRLPAYKVLSLGLVDGDDVGQCNQEKALDMLRHAHERLGDRLWVASSCPLQHVERAAQKCQEVVLLAKAKLAA
ncbi:5-methyltetrahydropteroyltriglutamate--homocysteine methyltransferase [Pseudomonas sp. PSKL.D1]|uniref:5-methyltetrahydropteroyltriglutamate-- homocysteine methyltransferase n=1 Tax=Pseudomonas sp. PSKL.D1 TaxID=3029060 RepID=UPI00406C8DCF